MDRAAALVLPVYYPGGGRRWLLHWWSYDERGHVVLAESERGLRDATARVFGKHDDVEIRGYCEVEVVGPSAQLCAMATSHALSVRISSFHHEVIGNLQVAVKAGRALPPPFAMCTTYEPDEETERDDDTVEWSRSVHYGCRHCEGTIRLVGVTPADLYTRYHNAWRVLHPAREFVDPKRVASRAAPAADGEPLWLAYAEFGDHSEGIVLSAIDLEEAASYTPAYLTKRVLFFFRRLRDLDADPIRALLVGSKALEKARWEQRQAESAAKRAREDRERIDSTIALFASYPTSSSSPPTGSP